MNNFIKHIGCIVSICIVLCLDSCNWGAGSYSYSEIYYINLSSSDDLIDAINKLKHSRPELNVYYVNEQEDTIIMDEFIPNFYTCRFLLDDVAYMCSINTNQQNEKYVCLQFVAICKKDKIDRGGHWKNINTEDLTKRENATYKKKFEEAILNNLGVPWRRMHFCDYFAD